MGLGDQIPREGRIAVTLTCARGLPDTRGRPCTRPFTALSSALRAALRAAAVGRATAASQGAA
jgi:hypothetical protein